jgi:serpin B
MAILPKDEDVNIADFVGNFTGADYMELYNSAQYTDVQTIMPKISFEYENDLNKTLIDLGMTDAFDSELAQFDDMVADPDAHQFYVGRVIHKTKIDINEDGTQAAAATVVMMKEMAAAPAPVLYVNLDRPYAFAIIDNETGAPVFMGTVNTTK